MDSYIINLLVNGKQPYDELNKLNRKLADMKGELTDIRKTPGPLNPEQARRAAELEREIAKVEKRLNEYSATTKAVARVMDNLEGKSVKQLKATLKELNAMLASGEVERGSKEWNMLTEAIRRTKGELAQVREQTRVTGNALSQSAGGVWGKLAAFGQKWGGLGALFTAGTMAYDRLMGSMQEYIGAWASIDAAMTGVEKYTGLARAEVEALNEELRKLDTTTSIEGLNALAADAGRLGITSRQQILDFVEAADQINVALGEDLGEGAVKNIGKIAQLFGDADRMGLKQAMLSTGSVINELAQSSSASEGYLMEFTARLAGVGRQAGLTQAQVMGFASVLDQGMVGVEKGATAMQNVLTLLNSKTAELAGVAGLNVKEFTNLLRTDANEAVLQFIEALNSQGGFDALAQKLTDMHMSGSGVTQTLSTLANNIGTLRATQQQAAQAFAEGTSVTNEYQKASSTLEARIQKQQERLHLLAGELGKQLYPAYLLAMQGAGFLGEAVVAVARFMREHIAVIIATVTALATLRYSYKLLTSWQTICTAAHAAYTAGASAAAAATHALSAAIKSNGFTALISLILSAVSALLSYLMASSLFEDATDSASKAIDREREATDRLKQAQDRAADSTTKERMRLEELQKRVHDTTLSYEQRKAALDELKKTVTGYHAVLTREGKLERDNVQAIADYISALEAKAEAQALFEELVEQKKRENAARRKLEQKNYNVSRVQWQLDNNPTFAPGKYRSYLNPGESNYQRYLKNKELEAQQAAQTKAQEEFNQELKKTKELTDQLNSPRLRMYAQPLLAGGGTAAPAAPATASTAPAASSTTGSGNGGTSAAAAQEDATKKRLEAIRAAYAAERAAQKQALADRLLSQEEYSTNVLELQLQQLDEEAALYQKGSAELSQIEEKRADVLLRIAQEQRDFSLRDIDRKEQEALEAAKERYLQGKTSAEQYETEQTDIKLRHLEKRLALEKEYGREEEAAKLAAQIKTAQEEKRLEEQGQFWKKVADFRKSYLKQSDEAILADKRAFAKKLLDMGLLTAEEYAAIIAQLNEEAKPELGGTGGEWAAAFDSLMDGLARLRDRIREGKADWTDYARTASAALSTVGTFAASFSQYYQAQQSAETAKVTARYDKEIEAAGQGTKRAKRLEEQKQKELAKIKTKYAKKQMQMEIAQAIATTAQNAIAAFGSQLVKGQPWTLALAIAAAGLATAQGALQIAIIRKQHEAQAAGYYKGGYTRGTRYRRQAGIVHEGEFVANHLAVQNPAVRPVLDLIDSAQRSGTISTLTPLDVSRAVAAPAYTSATARTLAAQPAAAPAVTVQAPPAVVVREDSRTAEALQRLNDALEEGIRASVSIDGRDGLDRQWRRWQEMKKRT